MISEAQVADLKNLLPSAKNILIALPKDSNIDRLAAALSLFLSLQQQGKEVAVVCEDTIKVGQAHLFGIDHVEQSLPRLGGGNLTLSLEGVAANGTVPALEKLDWAVSGNNLNLVFHVLPNQTFQPSAIVPSYQGGGFNLLFVFGAGNLNALGNLYTQNQQAFSGVHIVNIDNQAANANFGQTNLVDQNTGSISELTLYLIQTLNLPFDGDIATNLLAGIFDSSANLTNPAISADTYLNVSICMRAGGRRPASPPVGSQEQAPGQTQGFDLSAFMPPSQPSQPAQTTQPVQPIQPPVQPIEQQPSLQGNRPARPAGGPENMTEQAPQPSPEERPSGEGLASAESIEPDWLTPKIYTSKG